MKEEICYPVGRPWQFTDPGQATVYDRTGDELHASGLIRGLREP